MKVQRSEGDGGGAEKLDSLVTQPRNPVWIRASEGDWGNISIGLLMTLAHRPQLEEKEHEVTPIAHWEGGQDKCQDVSVASMCAHPL